MEAVEVNDSVLGPLREIAKRHRVTYRIDPALEIVGDARVTSPAPGGTDRDEVRLSLAIRHGSGYFEPVGHCQQTCLGDIVDMLRVVGVKPAPR